jgi:hypothetical protein
LAPFEGSKRAPPPSPASATAQVRESLIVSLHAWPIYNIHSVSRRRAHELPGVLRSTYALRAAETVTDTTVRRKQPSASSTISIRSPIRASAHTHTRTRTRSSRTAGAHLKSAHPRTHPPSFWEKKYPGSRTSDATLLPRPPPHPTKRMKSSKFLRYKSGPLRSFYTNTTTK